MHYACLARPGSGIAVAKSVLEDGNQFDRLRWRPVGTWAASARLASAPSLLGGLSSSVLRGKGRKPAQPPRCLCQPGPNGRAPTRLIRLVSPVAALQRSGALAGLPQPAPRGIPGDSLQAAHCQCSNAFCIICATAQPLSHSFFALSSTSTSSLAPASYSTPHIRSRCFTVQLLFHTRQQRASSTVLHLIAHRILSHFLRPPIQRNSISVKAISIR